MSKRERKERGGESNKKQRTISWECCNTLSDAARENHYECAEDLISLGADIELCDNDGCSPIRIAAGCSEKLVKLFIDSKANVNVQDNDGYSPLHVAVESRIHEIVNLLIRAGADVNVRNNNGQTPFYIATKHDLHTMMKSLIRAGADVNLCSDRGFPPIHHPVTSRLIHIEQAEKTLKLLLAEKADVNSPYNSGNTPIFWAVQRQRAEMVRRLIIAGAEVNVCNSDGDTPIGIACASKTSYTKRITYLLIRAGADVNVCNSDGESSLCIVIKNHHYSLIGMLISAGADVNVCDKDGTPLFLLMRYCSPTHFKQCIDAGVDVNVCDMHGNTASHKQAIQRDWESVFVLWYCGADLSIKNKVGKTALDVANGSCRANIQAIQDGTLDTIHWIKRLKKDNVFFYPTEWEKEEHWKYPLRFQSEIKQILLMHCRDQYDDGETNGFEWNMLPWEVVERIIKWRARLERQ